MLIVGLTGSIGMGKSTAAQMLRRLGVPVFDADGCVHQLQARGGAALPAIARRFPGVVTDAQLDRAALRDQVFANPAALADLEAIIHPLVRAAQRAWLQAARRARQPMVVLDIPLLLERGGWRQVDLIVVVSAPAFVQRARVLARPGLTADALQKILQHQMPDAGKRRMADMVVRSGLGKARALRDIRQLVHPPQPRPLGRKRSRR